MEIKNAKHAVRVLEALVEQSKKRLDTLHQTHIPGSASAIYLSALAEGVKAVLDTKTDTPDEFYSGSFSIGAEHAQSDYLIALAQAYAPRMAEAGMDVPGA